jgi:CBS domain-containing protein
LRVIGSLAFQLHCPTHGYLQAAMVRAYIDIDFAAYRKQAREITEFLNALGYVEDREVSIVSEGERSIFYLSGGSLHIDVFYDKLDFSHEISWQDRLEVDAPTIPLAELLLEKMQIFKINEKDIIDTIMLLLEHPLGDNDDETINVDWIAHLCAKDWGLWRTTTMNLDKVKQLGVFSGLDLLKYCQEEDCPNDVTVTQVMHPALTIHMTATLSEAANMMIQNHHHRLVVVDPQQPDAVPLGVISSFDIVAEMARPDFVWQEGQ